ncbi:unnamed protein product [Heterosigma akashiwo]|uniref:Dynein light chain n=1 Tax=Heterosigma akashiwo TaxID=2829 RepID=A0A6V3ATR8_HETAK|mmetsp:Transcript_24370/g.33721  ORF Transcript_24370/g.33721 Transcript_24370/m.33721 type:complete len:135 (-) Transcript_24370:98-502(-)|eukprot:CAMPEP_0194578708 /NCGR_PEP_ID=MMETSP0292-20121207/13030_1 /TAXON_ID=39354 /ORGANISM="Heterosigma akashiwo, Strain CCMP2393" /LENGTH=134 /DNA_ID=CAMNT_0039431441 /DNA_START=274 /DNA_END=678 /DNA_ORIENTATION=+
MSKSKKSKRGGSSEPEPDEIYDFPLLQEAAGKVAQEALARVLEGQRFHPAKVAEWTDLVCQETLAGLRGLSRGLKFAVSCLVFQKGAEGEGVAEAAPLATTVCGHWDPARDGALSLRWENASIGCLLVVSGYAL